MLRLNKLTDYGTVIMTHMARQPERVCSAAELAVASGITLATASKVLKILARQNLVQSQRGASGGYLLARAPTDISMVQIIDAMEGPVSVTECCTAAGLCTQEHACLLRSGWQRANHLVRQVLSDLTLADMAHPAGDDRMRDSRPHA